MATHIAPMGTHRPQEALQQYSPAPQVLVPHSRLPSWAASRVVVPPVPWMPPLPEAPPLPILPPLAEFSPPTSAPPLPGAPPLPILPPLPEFPPPTSAPPLGVFPPLLGTPPLPILPPLAVFPPLASTPPFPVTPPLPVFPPLAIPPPLPLAPPFPRKPPLPLEPPLPVEAELPPALSARPPSWCDESPPDETLLHAASNKPAQRIALVPKGAKPPSFFISRLLVRSHSSNFAGQNSMPHFSAVRTH